MEIGGDKNEIVPSASIPLLVAVFIIFSAVIIAFLLRGLCGSGGVVVVVV